ncbi:hypothetical protein ACJQWK_10524 [Exserohilum turcicum]|uniref:Methyltransferase domain-containing protein n=1 Tax=Exserohilum turcicum (strain 28A) TaxID=671987 RepID=R0I810_EXST2|nr:uncharacterized protein SETTUDRAFT_24038 [Exserohilum turcica Et28A]EOA81650.1 hypothetical protein SETTUDRAFT_24038 [Exserohilum turcica Et28A]
MTETEKNPAALPPWFEQNPTEDNIAPSIRSLLETYSGIPRDEVLNHVVKIRDEAWAIHPYPCIGHFRFVEPSFPHLTAEFDEVFERLGSGEKLLDMACCFGHTVRELVHRGAPAENIYGCDLKPDFIELGYKLFRDRGKLPSQFFTADILDPASALVDFKAQFDMIYAGAFFHLWGYDMQISVSKAVAALLRPQPGSMIFGRQIGAVNAREEERAVGMMFLHNVESFKDMWRKISDDLGVKFHVEARFAPLTEKHFQFHSDDTRRICFLVRRT